MCVFKDEERLNYRVMAEKALKLVEEVPRADAAEILMKLMESVSNGDSGTGSSWPDRVADASTVAPDPLAAARERGHRYALDHYENPDNLALLEARDYAGRNERSINEQRQSGELYALLTPPGKTRGFRYPKWQFDATPERLNAALSPFVEATASCWVIHSFMMRKRHALEGKSPAEVILADEQDIKQVIDLATGDLSDEPGAQ